MLLFELLTHEQRGRHSLDNISLNLVTCVIWAMSYSYSDIYIWNIITITPYTMVQPLMTSNDYIQLWELCKELTLCQSKMYFLYTKAIFAFVYLSAWFQSNTLNEKRRALKTVSLNCYGQSACYLDMNKSFRIILIMTFYCISNVYVYTRET